jgi:hypothetical protein
MPRPRIQISIDGDLWQVVHDIFDRAVMNLPDNVFLVDERNGYTSDALAVFPLSVFAFEAYFNTWLFSIVPAFQLSPSGVKFLTEQREALARLELGTRVLLVNQIACGQTFDRGKQLFQDFANLVKVRNAIVHFQMQEAPLETVRHLSERKIAWPEKIDKSRWSWVHRISTVESMRWAINTVSKTTAELSKLIGSDSIAPLHGVSEARLQMLLAIRKERAEQNGT